MIQIFFAECKNTRKKVDNTAISFKYKVHNPSIAQMKKFKKFCIKNIFFYFSPEDPVTSNMGTSRTRTLKKNSIIENGKKKHCKWEHRKTGEELDLKNTSMPVCWTLPQKKLDKNKFLCLFHI